MNLGRLHQHFPDLWAAFAPNAASVFRALLAALWVNLGFSLSAQNARSLVLEEMSRRTNEIWPRGTGHVVLGTPGSSEESKAYHEPGGNFSPSFGSFGVSIRILSDDGATIAASETVPMTEIRQRFTRPQNREIPGIITGTREYRAEWEFKKGRWDLHVHSPTGHVAVVIRSVGPAGGSLLTPRWDGKAIQLNDRWKISSKSPPMRLQIDQENIPNSSRKWETSKGRLRPVDDSGPADDSSGTWGRAVLEFGTDASVSIEDTQPAASFTLPHRQIGTTLELNLPDETFTECLEAQVMHLMMGLVKNETRPGDPNNYPLNWLRDGAIIVVALARAGHIDVAKSLLDPFLEHDFFGGFGAEADAPGLALWAISEVSAMARDPKWDQRCWPAIERKVGLIREMLDAKGPVLKPWHGPLVPGKAEGMRPELLCEAARDGLIWGKMDGHRPVIYVNAVTYAGWRGAVGLAKRMKKELLAVEWETGSTQLRTAWNQAFVRADLRNERNAIASLAPTWVVQDRAAYREFLGMRWRKSHDYSEQLTEVPLWTYFNIAEAHQWLNIGEPLRSWSTFQWFLDHQASPGLYSWWEGKGEENTFNRWEKVRGWVKPPHVTPHYWTAAETLLLQLGMLAYVDESGDAPRLLVGAGIREEWLSEPMSVSGIQTKWGPVGWRWDKKKLLVQAKGFPGEIVPSGPFAEQ